MFTSQASSKEKTPLNFIMSSVGAMCFSQCSSDSPKQADPLRLGSQPPSQTHPPTGTIHSPSALQCMRGAAPACALLWGTHVPLTGTKAVGSAPEGVAGQDAKKRLVAGQRRQKIDTPMRETQAPLSTIARTNLEQVSGVETESSQTSEDIHEA